MRGYQQLNKIRYYLSEFSRWPIPACFFRRKLPAYLEEVKNRTDSIHIHHRVDYYNRLCEHFSIIDGVRVGQFRDIKRSTYYFDTRRYLNYYPSHYQFNYLFGDVINTPETPAILKSRPIANDNQNSVLMKLNKIRHFRFINDRRLYSKKKDCIVWRGAVHLEHRRFAVEAFYDHPQCDIGQTNKKAKGVPWQKPFLSVGEQLQNKFILCIEGNDVASNLKWAMSSNSLVFMTKPKFETWFMEGTLIPGHHYVQIKDDYSDMIEKMDYYLSHPGEAEAIIHNANGHVAQFLDTRRESLISLLVLEKYFRLSGQTNC